MKRRIRSIFWLMTLCILGINGFQAYWLYTTYQLTVDQFGRTANEALLAVMLRQQVSAARLIVRSQAGGRADRIIFRQFNATDDSASRVIVLSSGAPGHAAGRRARLRVENLVRHHGERPASQPAKPTDVKAELAKMAASYHAELRRRDADAEFRLDTVRLTRGFGAPVVRRPVPARPGYSLVTKAVPLSDLLDDNPLHVQASFRPPTSYVLRRMGGLLAGSVGLLALTTGCFLLMLNTILRQKKLSEVKNDFINNMTHELKTPLATVSAAVEALQHFGALQDPQKTQTYLSISRQELHRLSELVDKVLHMAAEEREPLTLNPEPVRPAELVRELVAHYQLKSPKPVHFAVDLSATDSLLLDRVHVGNVINNLIDNAIKYSREQVSIGIRGRREGGGWRLTVQDDGIGIPRSYQPAIFDRFFRVPTGNLHPVKGFGLGLYYVRQVVERHGGHIDVRSEPGQGSEFSLWIPVG
ncbi:HAMP domain-containing histidine kinase [Hymenobacter sp. BT175]|uniref:sensor histidine kinase n=1 Tax=Hymenobacter translucens TaxID=2886507 RepID=UPI001D0E3BA2|nr:HAMP domain-containing sensor histidine kinase [Hymenobacter translucens]MCC2546479.1 HAMP domain-containing histidine kinase [Hymenobacter translucens]